MIRIIRHHCERVGESKWIDRYSTIDVELSPEIEELFSDKYGSFVGLEIINNDLRAEMEKGGIV